MMHVGGMVGQGKNNAWSCYSNPLSVNEEQALILLQ